MRVVYVKGLTVMGHWVLWCRTMWKPTYYYVYSVYQCSPVLNHWSMNLQFAVSHYGCIYPIIMCILCTSEAQYWTTGVWIYSLLFHIMDVFTVLSCVFCVPVKPSTEPLEYEFAVCCFTLWIYLPYYHVYSVYQCSPVLNHWNMNLLSAFSHYGRT